MRVVRLYAAGDLRLADEVMPVPGPGMSLVRVTAAGICGSDLHWWAEGGIGDAVLEQPLVPGHEAADGPLPVWARSGFHQSHGERQSGKEHVPAR